MSNIINSYRFVTTGTTYLLDTYTNAATAYSFRKLKTGATYACRIRRISDQAETDIELEDSGSIDLSSTVSAGGTFGTWVGANDARVTTWYDQSGNSLNATQTTAGNQPRIVNSGTLITDNSLTAIEFADSRPDFFSYSESFSSGGDISIFNVFNSDNITTNGVFGNVDLTQDLIIWFDASNNLNLRAYDGANVTTAGTGTSVQDYRSFFVLSNTGIYSYVGGTLLNSDLTFGTMSAISSQLMGIGTYKPSAATTTTSFPGKMQEFILYKSDKTSNRTSIESDIDTYYSIP